LTLDHPTISELRGDYAILLHYLASHSYFLKDNAACQRYSEEADRLFSELSRQGPLAVEYRINAARARTELAWILGRKGRLQESLKLYREGLEMGEQLAREFPDKPLVRSLVAMQLYYLAKDLVLISKTQEAHDVFARAVDVTTALVAEHPDVPGYSDQLTAILFGLGDVLKAANRPQEEEQVYRKSVALSNDLVAKFPQGQRYPASLAWARYRLATFLSENKRPADAEAEYRKALEGIQKAAAEFPEDAQLAQCIGGHTLGRPRDRCRLHSRAGSLLDVAAVQARLSP
jgi:tetratricopeptide (TPR) repeat protein